MEHFGNRKHVRQIAPEDPEHTSIGGQELKRIIAVLLFLTLFLASCGTAPQQPATPKASGDYFEVYSGELTTINYLVTATTVEAGTAANCVDSLIEFDNLGVVRPALAKSWEVSPDGLTWTFHIREGVKWVTWEGEEYGEVVAQDWVDALRYVFDANNASRVATFAFLAVKNGEAFFKGDVTDFSEVGVKAIDKYTLQYTLKAPIPYFLTMTTWVAFFPANGKFLAEKGEKFGVDNKSILYCGAYRMTVFEPQNRRVMVKNDKYWDADKVHIKTMNYQYNKEASTLAPQLFLKGDITGASIPASAIDEWMKDPAKKDLVRPAATSFYTYFYAFNFDPQFADEYEPDNWRIVVNNANFRKSMFWALDRKAAMITAEPYDPMRRISNTLTPKAFAAAAGKDFSQFGPLAAITGRDSFNKDEAVKYRDLAKQELAGKATFPVKVMMPFNSGSTDWTNRVQVVEQQMEAVLGTDYIDIVPVMFPATNFLTVTRRAGNYAFQECNGGPGFVDADAYTGMFMPTNTYSAFQTATEYIEANGKNKYENMINEARAEVKDMNKRFELFAEAEAFLINEAVLIPYAVGGGGYVATKLEPLSQPWSLSLNGVLFKGARVLDKSMNTEQYNAAFKQWEIDRAAALKAEAEKTK